MLNKEKVDGASNLSLNRVSTFIKDFCEKGSSLMSFGNIELSLISSTDDLSQMKESDIHLLSRELKIHNNKNARLTISKILENVYS